MTVPAWPSKDPDERLDYVIDWSGRLPETDSITASTWEVPTGLTTDEDDYGPSATVIWLMGGTDGESYTLTNTVTTAEGRILQETVRLKIRAK